MSTAAFTLELVVVAHISVGEMSSGSPSILALQSPCECGRLGVQHTVSRAREGQRQRGTREDGNALSCQPMTAALYAIIHHPYTCASAGEMLASPRGGSGNTKARTVRYARIGTERARSSCFPWKRHVQRRQALGVFDRAARGAHIPYLAQVRTVLPLSRRSPGSSGGVSITMIMAGMTAGRSTGGFAGARARKPAGCWNRRLASGKKRLGYRSSTV